MASFFPQAMSFYARFTQSAERFPHHIAAELQRAASGGVESHTYAELRQMAESVGHWLREKGVARGARCAFLAANSPRWVAGFLGTLANGCVAVPLDTAFNAKQVGVLLADSGSSVLFTDAKHLEVSREAVNELPVTVVLLDAKIEGLPHLDAIFAAGSNGFPAVNSTAGDLAMICYTSGTTSDPKGVMLTHGNLEAEAEAVFTHLHVDETDAILGILPLFHVLAQMANLMLPYSVGARVVYLEQVNTTELMRGLRERDITLFACVPQFFYLIHERIKKQVADQSRLKQAAFRMLVRVARAGRGMGINLGKIFFRRAHAALGPRMRYLITGGSTFDVKIGRDLETLGFDILQGYGLTETTGAATLTRPGERFVGSIGVPLKGVQVKILEPNEEGVGEIAICGGVVMKGYYQRPDATAEAMQGGGLKTGDLGRIDGEGRVFITGRQKEVIVLSSGKNVYPQEIEAHYKQSPWIKDICVVGVQGRAGEPQAERLHALIVPDFELMRERRVVNAKEVLRFDIENLSAGLPSTKRILSYDIWPDELPRTSTRKLKRFEIQKALQQQRPGESFELKSERQATEGDRAWLAQADVAKAMAVIRAASKKRGEPHPGDNLELDLGLDSMERVELVVALEQALGAKADEDMIAEVFTVRELVEAVRAGEQSEAVGKAGWQEILAEPVTDPTITTVARRKPVAEMIWWVVGVIVNAIAKICWRLEATGLENLPPQGPYLICPNHQSYLDGPVVASQLPFRIQRDCFYVGTSDIFGAGLRGAIGRSFKLVPVDPDANLVPAMRAGAYGLKHGNILVLYPEGERSIDGTPRTFKKGAAILAVHLKVPIVPVALDGFQDVWGRGKRLRLFGKTRIAFGEPIPPPDTSAGFDAAYETMTGELRTRVMNMWTHLHAEHEPRHVAVG